MDTAHGQTKQWAIILGMQIKLPKVCVFKENGFLKIFLLNMYLEYNKYDFKSIFAL